MIIKILMNPQQFIEYVHKGYPYPPDLARSTEGLSSTSPSSLAELSVEYTRRKPDPLSSFSIKPEDLKNLALSFHKKAGTNMPWVAENIENLGMEVPRIRMAHQANLFPSLGVVSQFFLLNALSQRYSTRNGIIPAQMFVIVDYDIAQDQRFRVARVPNVQGRDGSICLSGVVPNACFQNPMWTISKPSILIVKKWVKQLQELVLQDLKALAREHIVEREPGLLQENLETIEKLIWDAYDRADSLTEFNAFMLSKIVNIYWKMPTAFIFGRELQPLMQNAYEFLTANWPFISSLVPDSVEFFHRHGILIKSPGLIHTPGVLPFWITCKGKFNNEVCYRRVPLFTESGNRLIAYGRCERCHRQYRFDLGSYSKVNLDPIKSYDLSPRILMDNLLDVISLEVVGGVGYLGQAEHMLMTNHIALNMNWEMPPHCLWRPRGLYYGLAEYRAATILSRSNLDKHIRERAITALQATFLGKSSVLYYLMNQGFDNLLKMWDDFFFSDKQIDTINDGLNSSSLVAAIEVAQQLQSYIGILEDKEALSFK